MSHDGSSSEDTSHNRPRSENQQAPLSPHDGSTKRNECKKNITFTWSYFLGVLCRTMIVRKTSPLQLLFLYIVVSPRSTRPEDTPVSEEDPIPSGRPPSPSSPSHKGSTSSEAEVPRSTSPEDSIPSGRPPSPSSPSHKGSTSSEEEVSRSTSPEDPIPSGRHPSPYSPSQNGVATSLDASQCVCTEQTPSLSCGDQPVTLITAQSQAAAPSPRAGVKRRRIRRPCPIPECHGALHLWNHLFQTHKAQGNYSCKYI